MTYWEIKGMRLIPCCVLIFLVTVACAGGPPIDTASTVVPGYAADMLLSAGDASSSAKIMSAGDKFRMEVYGGRRSSVMIVRYDLDRLWVLIPSAARYQEFPIDAMGHQIPHFFMPGLAIEKVPVRKEHVGGVSAVQYRARITMCGRQYEGDLWESQALPAYPLKWKDDKRRTTVRWRNGRITALSDTLFAIPDGFTELPSSTRRVAGRENRCRKKHLKNQDP